MKRIVLLFVILLPAVMFAAGETGLAALKIGISARASGMGEAFTATADDASGLFWNPAGTAWVTKRQASFTYNQWLQDISHNSAGIVFPSSKGVIGLGIMLNSVDDFERRIIASEEPLGTFSIQDVSFSLSYAKMMGSKLSLGVRTAFLYEKIYTESSSGFAFDLGARYSLISDKLFAAAALQNLGSMSEMVIESVELPKVLRAGLAYHFPMFPGSQALIAALDYVQYLEGDSHIHAGLEYNPVSVITLRTGFQTGYEEKSISAGFGLDFGFIVIDYAYVPYENDLGNAQRFSLAARF